MTMNQLAQQIRVLRTAKNLSQDELAEKLYISRQAVSKWENGEQRQILTNWSSWQKSLVLVWIIWF